MEYIKAHDTMKIMQKRWDDNSDDYPDLFFETLTESFKMLASDWLIANSPETFANTTLL